MELLRKIDIHGNWLDLAAGDGRYNLKLLKKADFVVASDIDESALSKLWYNTPERYRKKLETKVFDLTKKFPFEDKSFDGVFSASTLHYFSKEILHKVFSEIDRILKSGGKIIIEFGTDMKRVLPNGELYMRKTEPLYKFDDAAKFLRGLLNGYKIQMIESEVLPELIKTQRFEYTLSCKLLILQAEKK